MSEQHQSFTYTRLTPDDKLRDTIVNLMIKCGEYKINGEKEKFANAVEVLFHFSSRYLTKDVRLAIFQAYEELKKTIRDIEKEDASESVKKQKILELRYLFSEEIYPKIIKNLHISSLFRHIYVGRLVVENLEDLRKIAREIRKPIKVEKILEVDDWDA